MPVKLFDKQFQILTLIVDVYFRQDTYGRKMRTSTINIHYYWTQEYSRNIYGGWIVWKENVRKNKEECQSSVKPPGRFVCTL